MLNGRVKTVVVLSGGPDPAACDALPDGAPIVAADGGADLALRLGLHVALVVGDMDSVPQAVLDELERAGARVERHPAAKDATDLELALDAAVAMGAHRILVVGSATGRADHALGQLLLLASERYRNVEIEARLGDAVVHVVRGERSLTGAPGDVVSLFALHGAASGVTTEGLLYPLRGERLEPGSTRGISNVFESSAARVTVGEGVVLVIGTARGATPAS